MRRLGAVLIVLAACGGGGSGTPDGGDVDAEAPPDAEVPPDAEIPDAMVDSCDPLAQTGCDGGEKCSWVFLTSTTAEVACVPDGSVGPGDACAFGEIGPTTGYDDCVAGGICVENTCLAICGVDENTCSEGTCYPVSGIFDGTTPQLGACFADPGPACNPLTQTGCGTGEKCTTIHLDDVTRVTGCAPDGTVATGAACVYGVDGETTGYDDCLAGNVCVGGLCEQICTTSPDSCPATSTCSRYAGVFDDISSVIGACDFLCDPVTQTRTVDGAAACGSPTPATPTRGCYGVWDFDFACTPVPATVQASPTSYQQGDTAYGPPTGGYYLNGCAPGYAPLLQSSFAQDAPTICIALCAPAPTSLEAPANANGLVGSGHTCADRGAAAPEHECRYLWVFETYDEITPPLHPDGVGFCIDPDNYLYDWDGDLGTPDTAMPRCTTLAAADNAPWGCEPYGP